MFIGIVGWVVVGAIVGFATSKLVNLRGDDPRLGMAASCAGAIVGGILYAVISGTAVSYWNMWSVVSAALGAGIGVGVWHVVRSRYTTRESYSARRSY